MRKKLTIGVLSVLIIFLIIYGIVLFNKYFNQNNSILSSNRIVFTQPALRVFGDEYILNTFPDKVQMHYPYFLIIQPEKQTTTIYNVEMKKKVKIIHHVLLDYSNGDVVYNEGGYNTFFNGKIIGLFCDQAFIVSKEKLLCVIRPNKTQLKNKLISINPETSATHDLYSPQDIITAIYSVNSTLYIAEYNYIAKKSYIVVNGERAEASDLINMFYQMHGDMYAASFKSVRNKNIESYNLINAERTKVSVQQVEKSKILFQK